MENYTSSYKQSPKEILENLRISRNFGLTEARVKKKHAAGIRNSTDASASFFLNGLSRTLDFVHLNPDKGLVFLTFLRRLAPKFLILFLGYAYYQYWDSNFLYEKADTAIGALVLVIVLETLTAVTDYFESRSSEILERARLSYSATNPSVEKGHKTIVMRGGELFSVSSDDLTVGDIVILSRGNFVPADMRILDISGTLIVDESLLGGDSGAQKSTQKTSDDGALLHSNMLYAYSWIMSGSCRGVVVGVGRGRLAERMPMEKLSIPQREQLTRRRGRRTAIGYFMALFIPLAFALGDLKSGSLRTILESNPYLIDYLLSGTLLILYLIDVPHEERVLKTGVVKLFLATGVHFKRPPRSFQRRKRTLVAMDLGFDFKKFRPRVESLILVDNGVLGEELKFDFGDGELGYVPKVLSGPKQEAYKRNRAHLERVCQSIALTCKARIVRTKSGEVVRYLHVGDEFEAGLLALGEVVLESLGAPKPKPLDLESGTPHIDYVRLSMGKRLKAAYDDGYASEVTMDDGHKFGISKLTFLTWERDRSVLQRVEELEKQNFLVFGIHCDHLVALATFKCPKAPAEYLSLSPWNDYLLFTKYRQHFSENLLEPGSSVTVKQIRSFKDKNQILREVMERGDVNVLRVEMDGTIDQKTKEETCNALATILDGNDSEHLLHKAADIVAINRPAITAVNVTSLVEYYLRMIGHPSRFRRVLFFIFVTKVLLFLSEQSLSWSPVSVFNVFNVSTLIFILELLFSEYRDLSRGDIPYLQSGRLPSRRYRRFTFLFSFMKGVILVVGIVLRLVQSDTPDLNQTVYTEVFAVSIAWIVVVRISLSSQVRGVIQRLLRAVTSYRSLKKQVNRLILAFAFWVIRFGGPLQPLEDLKGISSSGALWILKYVVLPLLIIDSMEKYVNKTLW